MTVPAREDWVLVLRMAAAGVGALYDLPLDVMDDLGIAIEESCDLLLHQPFTAKALELSCESEPGSLRMILCAQDRSPCPGKEQADGEISRLLIEPLVKQAALLEDEGSVYGIRLTLPAGV